jgi:primosomal protein N' (replication factor Y)
MRDERGVISREPARRLRREMTDAERRLWAHLRNRGLGGHKIRRQHQIGPYIADFYSEQHKLIIEVDGSQHVGSASDARRTAWLRSRGYRVIRFWNNDVLSNTDGVLDAILAAFDSSLDPSPQPSPEGEGANTTVRVVSAGNAGHHK